ncbi:MAG: flavin reductase family protein [Clostridiales bacterium]|jgi:flavin reductase (DIM6/NTAB) family NADH-FMN oxidoreductase RutF|nr:flavin reductase family protein [Clostridiales bacterium]
MKFNEKNIRELNKSPIKLIADEWALLSAGKCGAWNTMTISWGGIGELWGKDAAFVFVRPQRYTREFIESSDMFSLSFFGGKYKDELSLCGSKSGRDTDKSLLTGLTPVFDNGAVYIRQAELVLVCRKMAFFDLEPKGFTDKKIENNYSNGDYHRMYVGEIVKTLEKS